MSEPAGPNKDSVLNIGKQSLAMGTKKEYGMFHQSDRDRPIMPLRKFLFIGPEASKFAPREAGRLLRWTTIIDVWVKKELKRRLA